MGNQISRSKASQPFEDEYVNENNSVRIKSSNVSQNDMIFQRINSLRSITYVKRNNSNRIITYSQINPYVSNDDATFQNPRQTSPVALPPSKLVVVGILPTDQTLPVAEPPSELVVIGDLRSLCEGVPPSDQTLPVAEPPSELVLKKLHGTCAPCQTLQVDSLPEELVVEEDNVSRCPLPITSHSELVIEEQSCAICLHKIPLNFDSSESYVTTQCNHTFCKSCIQKVFDHANNKDTCTIACPMCRAEINRDILYIKITPRTFVDNPDLSFIKDNHNREMILEAYNVIHKNELWGKLRNLTPNEHEGFMFSQNPEIIKIMDLVNEKSTTGHSGLSMAITMRTIQQVARFGVDSLNTN